MSDFLIVMAGILYGISCASLIMDHFARNQVKNECLDIERRLKEALSGVSELHNRSAIELNDMREKVSALDSKVSFISSNINSQNNRRV